MDKTQRHAYPHDNGLGPCNGLTKREYLAGKIFSAMASGPFWTEQFDVNRDSMIKAAASVAVDSADFLLAALEEKK